MSTARKVPAPDNKQYNLFDAVPTQVDERRLSASDTGRRFVKGNPYEIFLGTMRLEGYLKQAGQRTPFIVADLLDEQDWHCFEQRYKCTGRAPYAPRQMLGLILYGVMHGVHSRSVSMQLRLARDVHNARNARQPSRGNVSNVIQQMMRPVQHY
jgi:hypothetical protein